MNVSIYLLVAPALLALGLAYFLACAIAERNSARNAVKLVEHDRNEAARAANESLEAARRDIRQLLQSNIELEAKRNVAWTKPAKRMPQNEVKRAFAVAPDAALWIALNQEIDDYLQEVMDQVSGAPGQGMTEEVRTHIAGGVEHVRLLQKRILDLHADAQKVDADLEGEADRKEAP